MVYRKSSVINRSCPNPECGFHGQSKKQNIFKYGYFKLKCVSIQKSELNYEKSPNFSLYQMGQLWQPRHPLPRIRQLGEGGVGFILEGNLFTNHRLRKIMSGPNLAETKHKYGC